MADLFISHVEEDSPEARELALALESKGYHVWFYERDSLPGATYIDQIVTAIDCIKVLVLLVSRRTLSSQQVDREVVRAFQHDKRFLPILKGLTVDEFQKLKPDWDHMLGAAGALRLGGGGVEGILSRVVAGLNAMGVAPVRKSTALAPPHAQGTVSPSVPAAAAGVSTGDGQAARPTTTLLSKLAQELSLSPFSVMRQAREVLRLDIRTPTYALTSDQAGQLRAALAGSQARGLDAGGQPQLRAIALDLGEGITLELVPVPAGRFTMGSPLDEEGHNDDEVEHEVCTSRPFYLGRSPVTQAQYVRIMGCNPSYFEGAALPVETVSWVDAVVFCEELFKRFGKPFRLPTEAEWECACRAGTTTAFHTGTSITTEQANFDGKFVYAGGGRGLTRWKTTPAGSFPPNGWGLHDMHGNVWEWCSDWYGSYPEGPVTDPQGPPNGEIRILRGGSWFHGPADCRSAQRDALDPGRRHSPYGFRVAMSAV